MNHLPVRSQLEDREEGGGIHLLCESFWKISLTSSNNDSKRASHRGQRIQLFQRHYGPFIFPLREGVVIVLFYRTLFYILSQHLSRRGEKNEFGDRAYLWPDLRVSISFKKSFQHT